jgi:hypothetical protein
LNYFINTAKQLTAIHQLCIQMTYLKLYRPMSGQKNFKIGRNPKTGKETGMRFAYYTNVSTWRKQSAFTRKQLSFEDVCAAISTGVPLGFWLYDDPAMGDLNETWAVPKQNLEYLLRIWSESIIGPLKWQDQSETFKDTKINPKHKSIEWSLRDDGYLREFICSTRVAVGVIAKSLAFTEETSAEIPPPPPLSATTEPTSPSVAAVLSMAVSSMAASTIDECPTLPPNTVSTPAPVAQPATDPVFPQTLVILRSPRDGAVDSSYESLLRMEVEVPEEYGTQDNTTELELSGFGHEVIPPPVLSTMPDTHSLLAYSSGCSRLAASTGVDFIEPESSFPPNVSLGEWLCGPSPTIADQTKNPTTVNTTPPVSSAETGDEIEKVLLCDTPLSLQDEAVLNDLLNDFPIARKDAPVTSEVTPSDSGEEVSDNLPEDAAEAILIGAAADAEVHYSASIYNEVAVESEQMDVDDVQASDSAVAQEEVVGEACMESGQVCNDAEVGYDSDSSSSSGSVNLPVSDSEDGGDDDDDGTTLHPNDPYELDPASEEFASSEAKPKAGVKLSRKQLSTKGNLRSKTTASSVRGERRKTSPKNVRVRKRK